MDEDADGAHLPICGSRLTAIYGLSDEDEEPDRAKGDEDNDYEATNSQDEEPDPKTAASKSVTASGTKKTSATKPQVDKQQTSTRKTVTKRKVADEVDDEEGEGKEKTAPPPIKKARTAAGPVTSQQPPLLPNRSRK